MSLDVAHAPAARPHLLAPAARTAWRAPVAAAAVVTAAAHIPVTGEHLHEALYIGVLFILLEVASVVLAALLVLRPSRVALAASAVVGALAVLALIVSRSVGLPLIGDDIGNWTEPLAVVSFAAEMLMVIGGAVAAVAPGRSRSIARIGLVGGLVVLTVGLVATVLATVVETGEDDATGSSSTTHMPGMSGMPGMHMPAADSGHEG